MHLLEDEATEGAHLRRRVPFVSSEDDDEYGLRIVA